MRHGTTHGYRRGCRTQTGCPNNLGDRPTCVEAIRTYRREYGSRRTQGQGSAVAHGTLRGYHAGCRDEGACPGGSDGVTCTGARRDHRRGVARRRGAASRALEPADRATEHLDALRAAGSTGREIARRAGIGRTVTARLLGALDTGVQPMATRATIERILDRLVGS